MSGARLLDSSRNRDGHVSGALVLRAQQTNPPPLVRENATEKISPHVYWIPDGDCLRSRTSGSWSALVGLSSSTPVSGRETARRWRVRPQRSARRRAVPRDDPLSRRTRSWRAGTSSLDEGHSMEGAGPGPRRARTELRPELRDSKSVNAGLLKGTNFRKTDISFDREYRLDLGDVHVRIVGEGPGAYPRRHGVLRRGGSRPVRR